jgi:hypothetical protein
MMCRKRVTSAVLLTVLLAAAATAQPRAGRLGIKARVLDILFPLDVAPGQYLMRLTAET